MSPVLSASLMISSSLMALLVCVFRIMMRPVPMEPPSWTAKRAALKLIFHFGSWLACVKASVIL